MSRDLTAGTSSEFSAPQLRPVIFVEIKVAPFNSPPEEYVRLWNGRGSVEWDSIQSSPSTPQTWLGAGDFGSISPIRETRNLRAEGIQLSLSGIPSNMIQLLKDDIRIGLPVKVWFGVMDSTDNIIADPYLAFSGRVDIPRIVMGGDASTITISCESDLLRLQIPNERRWTRGDQQTEFPGDAGFDYVEVLQDIQLHWGLPTPSGV